MPSGSEMVFHFGGQRAPKMVEAKAFTLNKKGYAVGSSHRLLKLQGSGVESTFPAELPQGEYSVEVYVKVLGTN